MMSGLNSSTVWRLVISTLAGLVMFLGVGLRGTGFADGRVDAISPHTSSAGYTYDTAALHAQVTGGSSGRVVDPDSSRSSAVTWVGSVAGPATTSPDFGVAAEGATPVIKAGAAGGETAGKAFPQSVKDAALAENPGTCVYGRMGTSTPRIDHAIPKSRGGNATLDNAQTTCPWCNGSKNNRDFPMNPPPGYEGGWPPPWWSPVE